MNRMWLGTILRVLTRGVTDERNEVLFLVDEAAHLGKIQALEDAITLMRGMGIRVWLFFQSLVQLFVCYGDKAAAILDNMDTKQLFCINAYNTADEVSKWIGDRTISIVSRNDTVGHSYQTGNVSHGTQGTYSNSLSTTLSDTSRRLLKSEEVMRLPRNVSLIFHRNMPVIMATLLRYYDAPEFFNGGTGRSARKGSMAGACLAAFGMCFFSVVSAVLASGLAMNRPVVHPLPFPVVAPAIESGYSLPPYLAPQQPYPVSPYVTPRVGVPNPKRVSRGRRVFDGR